MWIILISLVGITLIHGIILVFLLLFKRKQDPKTNSLPISLLILAFSLYLFEYFLIISGSIRNNPHLILMSYPAIFMMGPLILKFTELSIDDTQKSTTWWFAIPILVLIILMPFYTAPIDFKATLYDDFDKLGAAYPIAYIITKPLIFHAFTFGFLSYAAAKSNHFIRSTLNHNTRVVRWFRSFMIIFSALFGILFVFSVLSEFYDQTYFKWPIFFSPIPIAVALHVLAYRLIMNPKTINKWTSTDSPKYSKSSLSSEVIEKYRSKIESCFENDKPFLEASFSIDLLSQKIGIHKHHISQVINSELGMNFSELVNKKRIEEACHLLRTEPKPIIIHIALDVGFSNKASFYRAFSKVMGITPSEYISRLKAST